MKDLMDSALAWLRALAPRERVMVLLCAAIVMLTLVYVAGWKPLVDAHHRREAALERARGIATRIEQAAAQIKAAGPTRAIDSSTSLLAAVDQTSRSATLGKAPARVQPEGEKEVKVWIDDVPFDNLLRWLQELEQKYGISTSSAEIERSSAPGVVNVRVTLVRV
ncbi:MAG: type II secretion system protein M [Pseudomonadota bacterium]|nr:type II secretion system protein M [Pseudomonadota bacterium]